MTEVGDHHLREISGKLDDIRAALEREHLENRQEHRDLHERITKLDDEIKPRLGALERTQGISNTKLGWLVGILATGVSFLASVAWKKLLE